MEAKILAGIIQYQQLDRFPADLVQSYSGAFRTALNLYRKLQDVVDTPEDLLKALVGRKGAMPEHLYEQTETLIQAACSVSPATGDMLREDYLAGKLNAIVTRYVTGEEVCVEEEVEKVLSRLPAASSDVLDDTDGIENLLSVTSPAEHGLVLPLPSFSKRTGPLVPGDLVILAGFPGSGKTSLTAFLLGHALPEGRGAKLLWLNNEGGSPRIRLRCATTLTGLSEADMHRDPIAAQLAYNKALGDRQIIVRGVHGKAWRQVADIVRRERPTVCVLDMLDHVKTGQADRRDLALEYLYQDARQLGVETECVMVATSQFSAPPPGADKKYPSEDWFKDAKTGKAGAGTVNILMGIDPEHRNLRYFTLSKTKSPQPGVDWRTPFMVHFDEQTCQFKEVKV